eukprot:scaffold37524_cov65-Phaeocystis_antarctica.AAC.3
MPFVREPTIHPRHHQYLHGALSPEPRGGFPGQYLVLGRNIYIGHFSEPFRAITESPFLRLLRGTASEISPISSLPFETPRSNGRGLLSFEVRHTGQMPTNRHFPLSTKVYQSADSRLVLPSPWAR